MIILKPVSVCKTFPSLKPGEMDIPGGEKKRLILIPGSWKKISQLYLLPVLLYLLSTSFPGINSSLFGQNSRNIPIVTPPSLPPSDGQSSLVTCHLSLVTCHLSLVTSTAAIPSESHRPVLHRLLFFLKLAPDFFSCPAFYVADRLVATIHPMTQY